MLRIDIVSESAEEVVLKVDGWLIEGNLRLLDQEGRRHLQQGKRLILDLGGTRFIDRAGIVLLQEWSGERFALRGASLFVRELPKAYDLE